ncbi:hypothetical protein [Neomoorella glycerini]|uniref:hypothetical protein n=1 Tax=Neomoorella glycerini TaxID=55779 RepID=UPI0012E10585|nr:hypothetical protein [Moorella glycerini]
MIMDMIASTAVRSRQAEITPTSRRWKVEVRKDARGPAPKPPWMRDRQNTWPGAKYREMC